MYKHLFLEADSGAGKSTLIRKCISAHTNDIGGFSSQRLLDGTGETIAFRLASANDLRLAVPYEDTPETIFRRISRFHSSESFPEVFESEGMRLLSLSGNKKLILLDEIGGLELKSEAFRTALFEVLSGEIPCIGVIKQHNKAKRMNDKLTKNAKPTIADHNKLLRDKMLNELSCRIIQFKRNDPAVENEVKNFISQILF